MGYMHSGHLLPLDSDGREINLKHIFRHSPEPPQARLHFAHEAAEEPIFTPDRRSRHR
jgi:hypothetical protein